MAKINFDELHNIKHENKDLFDELKHARLGQGFTVSEFAEACRLSRHTITEVENKRTMRTFKVITRMAKELGFEIKLSPIAADTKDLESRDPKIVVKAIRLLIYELFYYASSKDRAKLLFSELMTSRMALRLYKYNDVTMVLDKIPLITRLGSKRIGVNYNSESFVKLLERKKNLYAKNLDMANIKKRPGPKTLNFT